MEELPGVTIFRGYPDLASEAFGGEALLASDEFFAAKENLIRLAEPVWREGEYTEQGKWMDGWEPRRRRAPGHDWCILRLGTPGDLVGVDIDTRWFTGNHAPYAALFACRAPADASGEWLRDNAEWERVLEPMALERGGHNVAALHPYADATHIKLDIYPAGGVARLRVHGKPRCRMHNVEEPIDLASAAVGGQALACSDAYFAKMDNLLLPGAPQTMGEGWETKRSPFTKSDWVVVRLGEPGALSEILIDTTHFKGNYPERAKVEAIYWPEAPPHALIQPLSWTEIVRPIELGPHQVTRSVVEQAGPWTHLRLTMLTDGGIARLRALGVPTANLPKASEPLLQHLAALEPAELEALFYRCCGSKRWVARMVRARPFASEVQLMGTATELFWHLGDSDWLEAFSHHPRIGEDTEALRQKFSSTATWASGEQAGVQEASEEILQALAAGNRAYEERFGFIFIVCASGLSAAEMLARLNARMDNPPDRELRIAAGEQLAITKLRLQKSLPQP